jgi:hypothetical protein
MIEVRTYSIDELVDLTGFSQRNIAYYIQQGLLPKVGRRGRKTRYPQLFVERLRFIKRVRELQDSGRLGSVTLPRIARVIWYLVERSGDTGKLPELDDRELQRLFDDESISAERVLGKTDDGDSVTVSFGKFGPYVRAAQGTASIDAEEFNSIDLTGALERISEKAAEKEREIIKDFREEGIQVRDGRYGPYVKYRDSNAKIPRDLDPTRITLEQCRGLIEHQRAKKAKKSASKRKHKLASRVEGRDLTAVSTDMRTPIPSLSPEPRIAQSSPVRAWSMEDELLTEGSAAAARRIRPHVDEMAEPYSYAVAASQALGVPLLDLDVVDIEPSVIRLVDQRLISKHRVLPITKRGSRLVLAMTNPADKRAIDDIRFQTGLHVEPVVVERDKLEERISRAINATDVSMAASCDDDFDLELSSPDMSMDDLAIEGPDDSSTIPEFHSEAHRLLDAEVSDWGDDLEAEIFQARILSDKIEREAGETGEGREKRAEYWTRVPITANIELSVKNIEPEHADLVEGLAEKIRSFLGINQGENSSEADDE